MESLRETNPNITLQEVIELEMQKPLRAKHRVKRAKRGSGASA